MCLGRRRTALQPPRDNVLEHLWHRPQLQSHPHVTEHIIRSQCCILCMARWQRLWFLFVCWWWLVINLKTFGGRDASHFHEIIFGLMVMYITMPEPHICTCYWPTAIPCNTLRAGKGLFPFPSRCEGQVVKSAGPYCRKTITMQRSLHVRSLMIQMEGGKGRALFLLSSFTTYQDRNAVARHVCSSCRFSSQELCHKEMQQFDFAGVP